jgi:hypothetical protein
MSELPKSMHYQILQHAEDLSHGDELAAQVTGNLVGQRFMQPGDPVESIAVVPVGAGELPEMVAHGRRLLDRLGGVVDGSLITLSVNTVGEAGPHDLDNAALLAANLSRNTRTPVTFIAKAYKDSERDGTITNIEWELVGATALALAQGGWQVSEQATLLMGGIDLVSATPGAWRDAHTAVLRGARYAQIAVSMADSQELRAAGLLPKGVDFPQMDRVLYYRNAITSAHGASLCGEWSAMTLSDYLAVSGFDRSMAYGGDIELYDRLLKHTRLVEMPDRLLSSRILENPRRHYARLQHGEDVMRYGVGTVAFRTGNDGCRGVPLSAYRDITRAVADAAIESLWAETGSYQPGRTLADGFRWYVAQEILGRPLDLRWRMPPPDWQPNRSEWWALQKAGEQLTDFRRYLQDREPVAA